MTADMPRLGHNLNWTGATGTPTWSLNSLDNTLYGSLTMISGMTLSQSQSLTFETRGASTLTSGGNQFGGRTNFNMIGGTVTLQDAYSTTSGNVSFVLNDGTFDANNFNVTAFQVVLSATFNPRTLKMGSGTWSLTGQASTVWDASITSGLTLSSGTATIAITDISPSAKNFLGGNLTYPSLSIVGGGTGSLIFTGNNTFNNFTIGSPKTLTLTAGTTQYITGVFNAVGVAGSTISINSNTPGTNASLSKSAGTVSADYLALQDSNADGGATWYAGRHSTNVSNNTGWIFSCAPFSNIATGNWSSTTNWTATPGPPLSCSSVTIVGATTVTVDIFQRDGQHDHN